MINLIDLSKWKKQKEIILELHREYGINVSSREWRLQVEKHNKKFANGEANYYITHSNSKGYKATTDYREALEAKNDYLKRARNMIEKARDCDYGFRHLGNPQLDLGEGETK